MEERLLVFDSSNRWISAGIYAEGIRIEKSFVTGRNAFTQLAPTIEELLKESGLPTVDRVVCALGPGSFTGVRIGVSAARAFAQLRDIPVHGINSLHFYLEDLIRRRENPAGVLIDAKQKRVYALCSHGYHSDDEPGGAVDLSPDDVLDAEGIFFADDPDTIRTYLRSEPLKATVRLMQMEPPSPSALLSLAIERGAWSTFRELKPIYMRSDPATAKYPNGMKR
jgi:tRNA threonylcarbamoyl adenosine modification protein YeaZ